MSRGIYDTVQEVIEVLRRRGYRDITPKLVTQALADTNLCFPLGESDLKDLVPFLGPKATPKPHDWKTLNQVALQVSKAQFLRRSEFVRQCREHLFGSLEPPFTSVDEAEKWIIGLAVQKDDSAFLLEYPSVKHEFAAVFIREGSPLDYLRKQSEMLAEKLNCEVHEAVRGILTDGIPWTPPVETTTKTGHWFEDKADCWVSEIRINYPWVPKWAVEDAYTGKNLSHDPRSTRLKVNFRPYGVRRRVGQRRTALQAFIAENQGLKWTERWQLWNRKHPDNRYDSWRAFRSASLKTDKSGIDNQK